MALCTKNAKMNKIDGYANFYLCKSSVAITF